MVASAAISPVTGAVAVTGSDSATVAVAVTLNPAAGADPDRCPLRRSPLVSA